MSTLKGGLDPKADVISMVAWIRSKLDAGLVFKYHLIRGTPLVVFGCSANLAIVDALGKPKGIQSFVPTVFFRIKIDKHKCLGISSQRIH